MNRIIGTVLVIALVGSGIVLWSNQTENLVTTDSEEVSVATQTQIPVDGEHYSRIVLPKEEKSIGATLILRLEDREPMTYTFPSEAVYTDENPLIYTFMIAEPLTPATLEVQYSDGEIRTMSQVFFDTTIWTP